MHDRDPGNPNFNANISDLSLSHNGSTMEVYNLDSLLLPSTPNIIYDEQNINEFVNRIVLVKEVSNGVESDRIGLTLTAEVQDNEKSAIWVPDDAAYSDHLAGFFYKSYSIYLPHNVSRGSVVGNAIEIVTNNGLPLVAWRNTRKNTYSISNNILFRKQFYSKQASPVSFNEMSLSTLIHEFGQIMIETVDYLSHKPLEREYTVNDKPRRRKAPKTNKAMGRLSTRSVININNDSKNVKDKKDSKQPPRDEEARSLLESISFKSKSALSLDDVGGLESEKENLRNIAYTFNHPEALKSWNAKRPQGVLLYGPPGTGKTMIAQALANEIHAEMITIQSSDIYDMWLGNSDKNIKKIFDSFKEFEQPTLVLFDEFDAIFDTDSKHISSRGPVAGIFKQEMNNLAKNSPNVIIVAITNDVDRIDPALIRSGRFDQKIYIPMPDESGRNQIFTNTVLRLLINQNESGKETISDDVNVQELAQLTEGFSGADIAEIFRRITMAKAVQEAKTGRTSPITQKDFVKEIENFRTDSF